MELEHPDPVRAGRRRRVLITGAGGQLGHALAQAFSDDDVLALSRTEWDVTGPLGGGVPRDEIDVVLHAAAWTDVDAAEADPQGAAAVNVAGTAHAAALKAPLVAFSTDYVFDGRKRSPYVESDGPNPTSAYGRTKLHGEAAAGTNAWVVRTSWLFGPTGHNFLRTMLRLGAERDELAVVDDQRGCPTSTADLAAAIVMIAPRLAANENVWGTYHYAGGGATTWHGFASRIVAAQAPLTGRTPRVTPIPTRDFPTPARRPANSVLDCTRFTRVFGFGGRPWTEEADRVTRAVIRAEERHVA